MCLVAAQIGSRPGSHERTGSVAAGQTGSVVGIRDSDLGSGRAVVSCRRPAGIGGIGTLITVDRQAGRTGYHRWRGILNRDGLCTLGGVSASIGSRPGSHHHTGSVAAGTTALIVLIAHRDVTSGRAIISH